MMVGYRLYRMVAAAGPAVFTAWAYSSHPNPASVVSVSVRVGSGCGGPVFLSRVR